MFAATVLSLLLASSTLAAQGNGHLQLHFLNVGQGDGALLITPGGQTVMFDNGPGQCSRPIAYMQQLGVARLDDHIASHYYADHIGCTPEVLAAFPLQQVAFDRGGTYTTQTYARYVDAVGGLRQTAPVRSTLALEGGVALDFIAAKLWGEQVAPPGPPQGLTSTVSGNTAVFVWQPPSAGGVPARYVLEASLSPGGPLIASMPVVGTSLDVPNVPNGIYYVRVRALNANGQSAPSNEVVVTMPAGGACAAPPNAPQSLTASAINNQVTLSWSAPSSGCNASWYSVQAGSSPGASNITVVNVGSATGLSASAPLGTYYVRVVAVNAFGGSAASNEVAVIVGGGVCMSAPNAPQGLTRSVNGNTVTLNWSAPSVGCAPTSYTVHAGSSPGQSNLAVVGAGAATSLTATASAGTYYVHVVASNALGTSAPSAPVSVIVTATSTPAPSGTSLPVVTWNIQINDSSEAHARLAMGLLVQMSPRTPEIVIVQEAHLPHVQVYLDELQKQTGRTWRGAFATQCAPGTWNGSGCSPWHQGVGIFTTHQIVDSGSLLMPYADCWTAARVAVRAAVNVNDRVVQVFGTHLQSNSCGDMSAQRRSSMAQFKTWAAQFSAPQIAGGDFNGETSEINTTSGMLPDFIDTWSVGTGGRVTAYGPTPTKKLDYLFVDDGGNAVPETSEVLYSTASASDHYPVYAVIWVR